jgi:hypothetical protein
MSQQPPQQQDVPGTEGEMTPKADHGETSYVGSGRLEGKVAVITGADSGIGKAVAIAYAREGADVVISYLNENEDAEDTRRWVEEAGRRAVLIAGDLAEPAQCREVIAKTVDEFGRVDVLVSNAAFQMDHPTLEEIPDEEWDRTLATNMSAFFHLVKAALPHMHEGASIIGSSSVNSDSPSPTLLPCGHEGRDRQHDGVARATPRGARHPGQQRRPGAGVDPAHPVDDARGEGGELRAAVADRPRGAARRARAGLRDARVGRGELRLRRAGRGDRRAPDPLARRPVADREGPVVRCSGRKTRCTGAS